MGKLIRSGAFSAIPERKRNQVLLSTLVSCEVCSKLETPSLIDACDRCHAINKALMRFEDANIPLRYWNLSMEKNFHGDPVLLELYQGAVEDLDRTYEDGLTFCLAGPHGVGKQLALDTELPTPNGYVKLSDLNAGHELFDENGDICKVIKLHPINISPESYKITFDDGTTVDACADHLWLTHTRKSRAAECMVKSGKRSFTNLKPEVRSTKDLLATLRVDGKQQITNHSIPCAKALKYTAKDLLVEPYILGLWLGDGHTKEGAIETMEEEILAEIKAAGYDIKCIEQKKSKSDKYTLGPLIKKGKNNNWINRFAFELRELKLLNNKHIPENYLQGSVSQRLALLQGILDTDGSINDGGLIEFSSSYENLANDVHRLILELGFKANIKKSKAGYRKNGKYKKCRNRYRITFSPTISVFRLSYKRNKIRSKKQQLSRTTHRFIVDIKPIASRPMRCITVDSPSNLFLITKQCIPTHNTMTAAAILKKAAIKGYNCLYVTLSDIVAVTVSAPADDKYYARKELLNVDFLVIDEFDPRYMPTGASSDLFGRTMEDVLRRRSENKLPLFMCTNSPNVVESFEGAIKYSIESLMNYAQIIPVLGTDFRKGDK
jgi:hypothetical protein